MFRRRAGGTSLPGGLSLSVPGLCLAFSLFFACYAILSPGDRRLILIRLDRSSVLVPLVLRGTASLGTYRGGNRR